MSNAHPIKTEFANLWLQFTIDQAREIKARKNGKGGK